MNTLGDELPKEQTRVREVLAAYKELGRAGAIGAMFIEDSLAKADRAAISGDITLIIEALNDLRGIQ